MTAGSIRTMSPPLPVPLAGSGCLAAYGQPRFVVLAELSGEGNPPALPLEAEEPCP